MLDQKPTAPSRAARSPRPFWPRSWIVRIGLIVGIGWLVSEAIMHRSSPSSPAGPSPGTLPSSRLAALGETGRTEQAIEAVQVRRISRGRDGFTIAEVDLTKSTLKLFWKKPDGSRFGRFEDVKVQVERAGERLLFATNAGIFDASFTPCGLHVEDGREYVPLNLRDGAGNFYLKPNGVLLVDARGAKIIDATQYAGTHSGIRLAVQSGPLLVRDGKIHSAFTPDSSNRRKRSGVGVASSGHLIFAISNEPVTFHAFASLFTDDLDCRDALYLDGVISRFFVSGDEPQPAGGNFAGILAVTVKQ